jgi:hypothetical protein
MRITRDVLKHNFGDTTLKQIKQNLKIKILILGQHKLLPEKIIITTVSIRHMLIWIKHSLQASIAYTHRHVHVFY